MESVHTKRIDTLRWLLIGAIAWPSAMLAGDNPFRTITKRNAFNLGAEPRLAKPAAKPAVEKPTDIKLTGIFKRNGVERAAIAVLKVRAVEASIDDCWRLKQEVRVGSRVRAGRGPCRGRS